MLLTKNFIQNVVGTWGEAGSTWLDSLASLVSHFSKKWQLSNLKASTNLSFNYILFADQKTENQTLPVVLKLCIPSLEVHREVDVLNHYAGDGSVKLLDSDLAKGALLLQALHPGKSLKLFFPDQDSTAVEITAQVMQKLHSHPVPKANKFPSLEAWLKPLDEPYKDIPIALLQKARSLSQQLLSTQGYPVLLHADLHHENILLNGQNDWIAIDPKGVVGEPAFEVGSFMRNPMPQLLMAPNLSDIFAARFDQFSTLLNIDKQRLMGWSFVQDILGAVWSIQDNDPKAARWIECALVVKKLL